MNPKYADDDYEEVVEKSVKHAKNLQKQGATNPARYIARIEHWEDGRDELYFYNKDKNRVPHRVAEKLLSTKEIKILKEKAKKVVLTERKKAKGSSSIITQARKATPSKLVTTR